MNKMQSDRTEMLYWLQEECKVKAICAKLTQPMQKHELVHCFI